MISYQTLKVFHYPLLTVNFWTNSPINNLNKLYSDTYDDFPSHFIDEKYQKEVTYQTQEILKKGNLDWYEMTLYEQGHMTYEEIYCLVEKIVWQKMLEEREEAEITYYSDEVGYE